MSIINRLTSRHLDDAALAELWTASAGGPHEAITDPHLEECADCRVRFSAFASWMQDLRDDAIAETDAVFTKERLAAQQAQIFKRLEASERPARVIAFPRFSGTGITRPSIHRWVTAAAAAGLLVGLGLGQLMDLRHVMNPRDSRIAAPVQTANSGARGPVSPVKAPVSDDASLQDLDVPDTPQYDAVRGFDTLTPRAADFVRSSR